MIHVKKLKSKNGISNVDLDWAEVIGIVNNFSQY